MRPWGLDGDRRWMVVDNTGRFVTAREHPQLVLIEVALDGPLLRLRGPGRPDLVVGEPTDPSRIDVTIWRDTVSATPADEWAHVWFSEVLEQPARLVFLDDPYRRAVGPEFGHPDDVVSFADGFPLLMTTAESLVALNDLILEGRNADEAPLPMTRFRPNAVVSGAAAWSEDGWRRLRIGSVTFRVAGGCGRCVLTTVDPDTAQKGREPLAALARHRNWDGGLWFGVNLIPDLIESADVTVSGAILRAGDPVEVLE